MRAVRFAFWQEECLIVLYITDLKYATNKYALIFIIFIDLIVSTTLGLRPAFDGIHNDVHHGSVRVQ